MEERGGERRRVPVGFPPLLYPLPVRSSQGEDRELDAALPGRSRPSETRTPLKTSDLLFGSSEGFGSSFLQSFRVRQCGRTFERCSWLSIGKESLAGRSRSRPRQSNQPG